MKRRTVIKAALFNASGIALTTPRLLAQDKPVYYKSKSFGNTDYKDGSRVWTVVESYASDKYGKRPHNKSPFKLTIYSAKPLPDPGPVNWSGKSEFELSGYINKENEAILQLIIYRPSKGTVIMEDDHVVVTLNEIDDNTKTAKVKLWKKVLKESEKLKKNAKVAYVGNHTNPIKLKLDGTYQIIIGYDRYHLKTREPIPYAPEPAYLMLRADVLDQYFKRARRIFSRGQAQAVQQEHEGESCFLTTAVCSLLRRPDNGFELNTLRDFRKNNLQRDASGQAILAEYDLIGPSLAAALRIHPHALTYALCLYFTYILPCVILLKFKKHALAIRHYQRLVRRMTRSFL